ncbi:MAG: flagellar hook-basal body complex protein FliE [Cellulosilyticaceae bacterium]
MIQEVQALSGLNAQLATKQKQNDATSDALFSDVLDKAKALVNATVSAEHKTTELTYDFMTGKNENIHDLMIAQEKSSVLLQFTMQVRNNVLEAYREIMRIPV